MHYDKVQSDQSPTSVLDVIQDKLRPCGLSTNIDEFITLLGQPFTPLGTLVREYTIPQPPPPARGPPPPEVTYVVYRSRVAEPGMQLLHRRLQAAVMFMVDAASFIEDDDDRWEIFITYQRERLSSGEVRYSTVAYTTVYRLFRYPEGSRWRVSQFLVLPPFQRKHHGAYLLDSVYAAARCESVSDVTVELAAKGMQQLRTVVDMHWCQRHGLFQFAPEALPAELTSEMIQQAQQVAPLTERQITLCYEAFMWRAIDRTKEDVFKPFRLQVKRRLVKEMEEQLAGISREERVAKLQVFFELCEAEYQLLLAAFNKLRATMG